MDESEAQLEQEFESKQTTPLEPVHEGLKSNP